MDPFPQVRDLPHRNPVHPLPPADEALPLRERPPRAQERLLDEVVRVRLAADERLRDTADPLWTPVREVLAEDIARLKGLAPPDYVGLSARLAGLGTDYTTRYDEWELTPFEAMLMEMVGGVMAYFDLSLSAPPFVAQGLLGDILEDLRFLAGSNEGLTVAAHCLCESQ